MANPLLLFLQRLLNDDDDVRTHGAPPDDRAEPVIDDTPQTSTFFLVLRRMRAPLIVLILIFSISVLGLTLIPGVDAEGRPWRMTFFDAFYVMSYTATTIGFGEIPYPFSIPQRMWVTVSIYLGVIGWAYAVGTLLAMLQDRDLRRALSARRFARQVAHLGEPFLLVAGYGQAGQSVVRALDADGRRLTVLDISRGRINSLDLDPLRADVPGLAADASVPANLTMAGLGSRHCAGVLALTSDDRANLAVVTAAAMLRPDLPVVARAGSSLMARRMSAFGSPAVINPFDAFGDHLRTALRVPAAYQLSQWLTSPPGTPLPARPHAPRGHWVVLDNGQFGQEMQAELREAGLDVTLIAHRNDRAELDTGHVTRAALETAAGFVAGSDDDQRNLTATTFARGVRPDLFVVARQNRPENAPLFQAAAVDLLLVAADVTAHEVLARLASPLLGDFLREASRGSEAWAAEVVDTLVARAGSRVPVVWEVRLDDGWLPELPEWLETDDARLGDLLRSPADRDGSVDAVTLLLARGDDRVVTPDPGTSLRRGDTLLLAGSPAGRYALDTTLLDPGTFAYVTQGREEPTTLVGRWLQSRRRAAQARR